MIPGFCLWWSLDLHETLFALEMLMFEDKEIEPFGGKECCWLFDVTCKQRS